MKITVNSTRQKGFMLLLAIIFIAATILMVTKLAKNSNVYMHYVRTVYDRDRAQIATLNGLDIALAQLNFMPEKKDEKSDKKESPEQSFIKQVGPLLNYWQSFILTEEKDGVDADIKICISAESGKLNINSIYDFKEKKFIAEAGKKPEEVKKTYQEFFSKLEKFTGKNLFQAFENVLKKRKYPFNDVTELLCDKLFLEVFSDKILPEPKKMDSEKGDGDGLKKIFLTDLFTIWPEGDRKINPWVLSQNMCVLFGLNPLVAKNLEGQRQNSKEWTAAFKPKANWQIEWNKTLALKYKKDVQVLPSWFFDILSKNVSTTIFSVVCCGKVGQIEQKLLVLLQRESVKENGTGEFRVKRFYWF